jgi:hypothetical protein
MSSGWCGLLLVLLAGPATLAAQDTHGQGPDSSTAKGADSLVRPAPRDSIRPQFEPSYVVTSILGRYAPEKPDHILLEANVAPPFYVASWGHNAFVLTPRIVLRQFIGNSEPVRPPSFMPRLTYYHWWSDTAGGVNYFSAMLSHHSNGQDAPHRNADSTLNHINGNFSTNFVEVAYQRLVRVKGIEGSLRGSLEVHIPGLYDKEEMRDYSKVRPGVQAAVRWGCRHQWSVGLAEVLLIGGGNPDFTGFRRLLHWATVAWEIPGATEVSLFANGFAGQDYYNNNYDQYRTVLRLGIAANRGRGRETHTPERPAVGL